MAGNITSANSVFTISCADFGIASTALEGYAVDSSFNIDALEMAIPQLGVDGKLSVGWVPRIVNITLTFQADSPSIRLFETIATGMDVARNPLFLTGTLEIPSIGKSYSFGKGVITNMSLMPSGGRVLNPQTVTIAFESIKPMVI